MNILIIGATSGIGHSLWHHYISSGNNVVVTGRRTNILDEMCAESNNTKAVALDIADDNSISALFEKISQIDIDLAIICAGIGDINKELDYKIEAQTIKTNVSGWTYVVDSLYHLFEKQRKGHLVAITSVGGWQPTPTAPSYSASKAFQINYIRSLQRKKNPNIHITEIRPGLVDTAMAKGDGLFWVMPLPKVTAQIIRAITKKKKLAVVTKRWKILNWIVRHLG